MSHSIEEHLGSDFDVFNEFDIIVFRVSSRTLLSNVSFG